MKPFILVLLILLFQPGCIKNSDYSPNNVYQKKTASLTISYNQDSLPADGSGKDTINLTFLKDDTQDSVNISLLNLTVTTSAGTFTNNGLQTITLMPQYRLDSNHVLNETAQLILQSSTKKDSAMLKFTYAGVEKDTGIKFYSVFPDKIKLSASSLLVAPNFSSEDTIYAQLSKTMGTPTSGNQVQLYALDSLFKDTLGTYRAQNNKSNATGLCSFVFVLGDSTINGVNYRGTINFKGIAVKGSSTIADTLQIYSR